MKKVSFSKEKWKLKLWQFKYSEPIEILEPKLIEKLPTLIHSLSVYKKHLYKKRLVEFSKTKKRQLVDFRGHKKHVSWVLLMKFDK